MEKVVYRCVKNTTEIEYFQSLEQSLVEAKRTLLKAESVAKTINAKMKLFKKDFFFLAFFVLISCNKQDDFTFVSSFYLNETNTHYKLSSDQIPVQSLDKIYISPKFDLPKENDVFVHYKTTCFMGEDGNLIHTGKLPWREFYFTSEFLHKEILLHLVSQPGMGLTCNFDFKVNNSVGSIWEEQATNVKISKSQGNLLVKDSSGFFSQKLLFNTDKASYMELKDFYKYEISKVNQITSSLEMQCEHFQVSSESNLSLSPKENLPLSILSIHNPSFKGEFLNYESIVGQPVQSCSFFALSKEGTVIDYSEPVLLFFEEGVVDWEIDTNIIIKRKAIILATLKIKNPTPSPLNFILDVNKISIGINATFTKKNNQFLKRQLKFRDLYYSGNKQVSLSKDRRRNSLGDTEYTGRKRIYIQPYEEGEVYFFVEKFPEDFKGMGGRLQFMYFDIKNHSPDPFRIRQIQFPPRGFEEQFVEGIVTLQSLDIFSELKKLETKISQPIIRNSRR